MYILFFCKIKNITVLGRASITGRGYGLSMARRSYRDGPDTIKSAVPPASPPDKTHLAIYTSARGTIMMVLASVATTSFVILLLFSLPSCLRLRLRATPFSTEGMGAGVSSPYSPDTSPDTNPCSGYYTSMRTFNIMRAPSFSLSPDVPFVFPAFALFFLPNLLPRPRLQPRADRRSSTWVRGESVLLLAFLRACRRGGHGGACSAAAVDIYYGVGDGVMSPQRVQGWEGTRIISPFSD
jgi:hypothetical protein